MQQAAFPDCLFFDLLPFPEDSFCSAKVDIGWGQVTQAFMIALMIIVLDELTDRLLKGARQIVVFEQDAVLERLVPTLDLALRLRMIGGSSYMIHALILKPIGQVTGDITAAIVTEQAWTMGNGGAVAA